MEYVSNVLLERAPTSAPGPATIAAMCPPLAFWQQPSLEYPSSHSRNSTPFGPRRRRRGGTRRFSQSEQVFLDGKKMTRADLEKQIGDFFVFEVDRNPVACAALHQYPEQQKAEIASVFVDERYGNQGIGVKLISYLEGLARQRKFAALFCLSTQAVNYFAQKGGFKLGPPDDLPPSRRERYEANGRNSQVLVKPLQ